MIDLKEQAGIAMNVRGQFSDPIADPQVTLGALAFANELGRLLWRMKYGQDFRLRDSEGRSALHRATLMLANCVRVGGRFSRAKFTGLDRAAKHEKNSGRRFERSHADVIERMAHRAILEWIEDLCPRCDGRGVVGRGIAESTRTIKCSKCNGAGKVCLEEHRVPFAARTDGRGPIVYREIERCDACHGMGRAEAPSVTARTGRQICPDCNGCGRREPDHAARSIAIGVTLRQYHSHWQQVFRTVFVMLDAIDAEAHDTTRRFLMR